MLPSINLEETIHHYRRVAFINQHRASVLGDAIDDFGNLIADAPTALHHADQFTFVEGDGELAQGP